MARSTRRSVQKKFLYFFLNGKVHKVLKAHRSKDELIAWCYEDKKRVLYSYSQVKKNMESAYTISQASKLLNRHKVTVQNYILGGHVKSPQKIYPIGNPDGDSWSQYMLSESDILDMHSYILDAGYSSDLPTRAELKAILKNNLILYTKTEEGKFVPVWKAE